MDAPNHLPFTDHPITPPPELVRQWATTNGTHYEDLATLLQSVATQAARWGADQELEACVEHLKRIWSPSDTIDSLYTARRPKPPSLKEQALVILDDAHRGDLGDNEMAIIRRALKALPE